MRELGSYLVVMRVSGIGGRDVGGSVFEWGRIVMDGIMDRFGVHLYNGLRMVDHLTETRVALGDGGRHRFDDGRRMIGESVGSGCVIRSSVADVRGRCVNWRYWMMDVGSGVFQCRRGSIIGTVVCWSNGSSSRHRYKQAQELQTTQRREWVRNSDSE